MPPPETPDGDSGITDRDLRICTVRIHVGGLPKGTGFFIAPGHLITCAHVVAAKEGGPVPAESVTVAALDDATYTVQAVPDFLEEEDLAVVRVTPAYRHPCVLLIPDLRMSDPLITFGYTEARPEGVASPLTSEGLTGDDRLQTFGAGQVRPGMSGAPVLNSRTGGVCGVLARTRDQAQSLGGYAIPLERLGPNGATLMRQNRSYHDAFRDWYDRLSLAQRKLMRDARVGTAAEPSFTAQLVITVGREGYDWEVSARQYPGEALESVEVDLNAVREKVARLFRDWASRGRADPNEVAPGRFDAGEDVRLLGSILYSAVCPGAIGRCIEKKLRADERLLLALHFDPQIRREIVELPWEYLYLLFTGMEGGVPLARDERLAFVRVRSPHPQPSPEPRRLRLSVLVCGVHPPRGARDTPPVQDIVSALRTNQTQARLELDVPEMPTASSLREQAGSADYDVLHYVGFGHYAVGSDQLAVFDGEGGHEYLDPERFAALLPRPLPPVVVLQQVDPPLGDVPADMSAFAWRLLDRGAQAVIAYQFPLPPLLTVTFNEAFYRHLFAGSSFELAAQKSRAQVWSQPRSEFLNAYLSPAAFAAQPGELRLVAATADTPLISRVGVAASHA
jgi:hypothetical protein